MANRSGVELAFSDQYYVFGYIIFDSIVYSAVHVGHNSSTMWWSGDHT